MTSTPQASSRAASQGATAAPQATTEPAGKPTLGEAIGQLDPEDDKHWTSNNLPTLDVLESMTGKKVARSDVDAVAEGYTRAKARAANGISAANRPAFLPVALVPHVLRAAEKAGADALDRSLQPPQWRRQWWMWRALRSGPF